MSERRATIKVAEVSQLTAGDDFGITVTDTKGNETDIRFMDPGRYGLAGLNMFLDVLPEETRDKAEKALTEAGIIGRAGRT